MNKPEKIHRKPRTRLAAATAAVTVALGVGLTGCVPPHGTPGLGDYEQAGYTSADLRVVTIPAEERGDPISFGGVTEMGEEFDSASTLGRVTVANFWYATCGPCRAEAASLEAAWQSVQDRDVQFIGINILDQADTAQAFASTYGITYPSLLDTIAGEAKLAFAQVAPIQATPTTVVLDSEGRVAARVIGPIDSAKILITLITDTLNETP